MSRTITLLLVFWNLVLSILVGLALTGGRSPAQITRTDGRPDIGGDSLPPAPVVVRDSAALKEARIAYFNMDSIQERFLLVKESAERVRAEAKRLDAQLGQELQKAQTRAQELATKDQTFSTQAQMQADQEEFQNLQMKIQNLRERSQDRLENMQVEMLTEISREIEGYLEEYNRSAGFDYIFSIQSGGQVWVGNERLDITSEVLDGLNTRHRSRNARR
jgi:outer membrane protein